MRVETTQSLIAAGLLLNVLISSGTLWKMVEFARNYGRMEKTVEVTVVEIEKLRQFANDVRDGKIHPVKN